MRIHVVGPGDLGPAYEGATLRDALEDAVAARGLDAGTILVVDADRVRLVSFTTTQARRSVTITQDSSP